ncbi:MAG TPA: ABC transporter permease [Flavobacteriales bacterium]|nr:ABC transporter permease [Flavobacteriales bacterium]
MKRLPFILKKEFIQIFRNKAMLPIIFVVPIVQLLILANAADFEIRNIRLDISDADKSADSRELISKFEHSPFFEVSYIGQDYKGNIERLDRRESDAFLTIPDNFSHDLKSNHEVKLKLDVDGIDGQKANLTYFYAANIIRGFRPRINNIQMLGKKFPVPIQVKPRYWYNPELDYKNLMVPGILAVLVTMVGMFLSSMNIVREKEIGTIEQLNVTPITKVEFIIGKLFPFWVISLVELGIGLTFGKLIFDIPIVGSLPLLFSFTAVYLLVMLGFGLLISTFTHTQQQAMFVSWFFLVIFILMGGLFTAIENMPSWAQKITWFNPVSYFIEVLRLVLLKGSGFNDIMRYFGIVGAMALVVNSIAIFNYKKRQG